MDTNLSTDFEQFATQVGANISKTAKKKLWALRLFLELQPMGALWLRDALGCSMRTAQQFARRALRGDWVGLVIHGNAGRRGDRFGLALRLLHEQQGKLSGAKIKRRMEEMGVVDVPTDRTLRRWKRQFLNIPKKYRLAQ